MSKGTLRQIWFFLTCLCVVTYLNASSSFKHAGMLMQDLHGVVYQCEKPNLIKEGLCRDYGRVQRTKDGLNVYTSNNEIKHITFNQKPLISKKPIGHEVVEVVGSKQSVLNRVIY